MKENGKGKKNRVVAAEGEGEYRNRSQKTSNLI